MSISLPQLLDCLLRTNLVADTDVDEARTALQREGKPADAATLAGELVARGGLTPYQAQEVLAGRGAELVLGNYAILGEVGAGGMGRVYRALHRRMNRVVALKLLRRELTGSPDLVARFQQEVQAAARLNHPNAVAAYDADECELGHFLVMEYVEGCDLGRVVARTGPLPVTQAIDAIRQAALGLEYAHGQGIVHRDVKPANLLRDVSGVVKVADLGLARLSQARSGAAAAQTGTGWVAGTVDFMSPEQTLDTSTVDHRSDIYSLGHTLYYLLTGRAAFELPTALERFQAHRTKPAPWLQAARDDVPEALERIYQKMVAKQPHERYASMAEVARDLAALQQGGAREPEWDPAGSTFLIVEASRLLVGVVRRCLGQLGADDIHVCGSGQEALQVLEKLPADVVLAGMQLPDMTGLELAQRLRHDLPWSRAAVVVMTSDPPRALAESVRRLGRVGILPKPFDSATLRAAAAEALGGNAVADGRFANLAGLNVLLVDDSSVARRRMQQVLTDLGFARFTTAEDGAAAAAILERERFDLVVTDYNMPRMDGRELLTHIRQNGPQKDVPVILCTTEFDPAKLAPMYQLGVSAICNKSFDPELVRNLVVRLFKSA